MKEIVGIGSCLYVFRNNLNRCIDKNLQQDTVTPPQVKHCLTAVAIEALMILLWCRWDSKWISEVFRDTNYPNTWFSTT